ncbi:MAG: hypothetical protein HUU37_01385 [Bdellovibrionales bacterium]|nr:hypothetical protein [Bdellovibrionales bacterium]
MSGWRAIQPGSFADVRAALAGREPVLLLPPSSRAERERLSAPEPPSWARLAVFTSGSTGEAKLVIHSEENLRVSASQVVARIGPRARIATTLAPWGMAGSLLGAVLPEIANGVEARGVSVAEAVQADFLFTNPWHLAQIPGALKARRVVSLTGWLPPRIRGMHPKAEEIFGLSEAAGPVLWNGEPLGAECALAGDGELLLRGRQMSPALEQPFATGDVFLRGPDGRFVWQARKRSMINVAGRKVPPRLVEGIVGEIPGVSACVALPVEDAVYGERVGLVLEGEEPTDLVPRLRAVLSCDLMPVRWVWVERLPRLANGKPDLAALRILLS